MNHTNNKQVMTAEAKVRLTLAQKIGRVMREVRNYQGVQQTAVARKMGISQTVYSEIEHGKVEATFAQLERACVEFELSVWQLVQRAERYKEDGQAPAARRQSA